MRNNKKLIEGIGFGFEVLMFFISGSLLFFFPLASIIIFVIGIALAVSVGKLIKERAIEEYNNKFTFYDKSK